MTAQTVSIGKAAKLLKVSIVTLRRWEKRGLISPQRSSGGTRYYDLEELKRLKGNHRKIKIKDFRSPYSGFIRQSSENVIPNPPTGGEESLPAGR